MLATPQLWYRCLLIVLSVFAFMTGSHGSAFLTTITNAILLGYLVVAVWTMLDRGTPDAPAPRLRGAIATWMIFVALISHSMLSHWANPIDQVMDPDPVIALEGLAILFLHYVLPIGILIDWLVFGPRGRTRWVDALWWPMYPLAYGLLTILRALLFPQVADRIPYPFMEPGSGGWLSVAVSLLPMIVGVALVSSLVIGYDRLAARRLGGRTEEQPAAARR